MNVSSGYFYPRSPYGERLWVLRKVPILSIFLSTLSLRRATRSWRKRSNHHKISIHALLTESDPRGTVSRNAETLFLSTLSLRRATRDILHTLLGGYYFYPRSPYGERHAPNHNPCSRSRNFYPRSPYGERHYLINTYHRIFGISIHALLTESDKPRSIQGLALPVFLSTLSLRRATSDMKINGLMV